MEPQTGKQSGDSMLEYENDKNDKSLQRTGLELSETAPCSAELKSSHIAALSAPRSVGDLQCFCGMHYVASVRAMAVLLKCCSLGKHVPGFDSLGRGWRERKGDNAS